MDEFMRMVFDFRDTINNRFSYWFMYAHYTLDEDNLALKLPENVNRISELQLNVKKTSGIKTKKGDNNNGINKRD